MIIRTKRFDWGDWWWQVRQKDEFCVTIIHYGDNDEQQRSYPNKYETGVCHANDLNNKFSQYTPVVRRAFFGLLFLYLNHYVFKIKKIRQCKTIYIVLFTIQFSIVFGACSNLFFSNYSLICLGVKPVFGSPNFTGIMGNTLGGITRINLGEAIAFALEQSVVSWQFAFMP